MLSACSSSAHDPDREERRPAALHGRLVRDRQHPDLPRERTPTTPSSRTSSTRTGRSPPRSRSAKAPSTARRRSCGRAVSSGTATTNAIWGMQFVWPIKAEYLIAHVDPATPRRSSRAASATTSGSWPASPCSPSGLPAPGRDGRGTGIRCGEAAEGAAALGRMRGDTVSRKNTDVTAAWAEARRRISMKHWSLAAVATAVAASTAAAPPPVTPQQVHELQVKKDPVAVRDRRPLGRGFASGTCRAQ